MAFIHIRCTEQEKEQLRILAHRANLNMTEFILNKIFDNQIVSTPSTQFRDLIPPKSVPIVRIKKVPKKMITNTKRDYKEVMKELRDKLAARK